MSRTRTRMLAAGTALLVAAAVALPATAPAFATAGPTFDVSADPVAPVAGNTIELFTRLEYMPPACYLSNYRPAVTYTTTFSPPTGTPTTSSGTFGSMEEWDRDLGGLLRYRLEIASAQAGWTYELSAASADPCFGDGQTFSDSVSVTIPADPSTDPDPDPDPDPSGDPDPDPSGDPWVFEGDDTIHGIYREQTVPLGVTADDYEVEEDVEILLVPFDSSGPEDAVDTAYTDADGYFELTAPVEDEYDAETAYVLLAAAGDGEEFYFFYTGEDSPASPSSRNFSDLELLYPYDFDGERSYDLYAGFAPGLSSTEFENLCDYDGQGEDVDTASVEWQYVCLTDGTVDDAETAHLDDAFDTFGNVVFPRFEHGIEGEEYSYYVTADSHSSSVDAAGHHFSFRDDDVMAFDEDGVLVSVDVVVERTIKGSWMSWSITVYDAGTSTIATDVPFYFDGELGSSGDTVWGQSGDVAVSTDGGGDWTPLIGHRLLSEGDWSFEDGEDDVSVRATGTISYVVAVIDYCGEAPISDALEIMAASATQFGSDILGYQDDCPAAPSWMFAAPALTVGTPYDHTFTAPSTEPWDWYYGGDIDPYDVLLPEGMEYEIVNEWENGLAPAIRIFGTPTLEGPYSFGVYLEDDYGHDVEFVVEGTVQPVATIDPAGETQRQLDLELNIQLGDKVAGASATATAEGLKDGAAYDIIVRSTPQSLGVGTVPTGGVVTRTVTLPSLEAGWHSLTFTSTWAAGGAAVGRLWFQVSETGTLLAVSDTAPNLAYTGANDPTGGFVLASVALLAGLGLVSLRRRQVFTH